MSAIKETKGSVIIAALIIALITGSLAGIFLKTVTEEVKNAYRARMSFQAVNLAEAGLDWAMYALIHDDWDARYWTQGSTGCYFGDSFPDISYSWKNELRTVKVYIEKDRVDINGNDLPPLALAEGTITLRNGMTVSRQIFVELTHGTSDDPTNGGYWGNGILGKIGLNFGGNKQTVDSFSTKDPGKSPSQTIADYYDDQTSTTFLGDTFANSNGSGASLSVKIDDIILGNADIYGTIASGAASGTDPSSMFGPNGTIYDSDSGTADGWDGSIDYDNIAFEFDADLPDVPMPTYSVDATATVLDVDLGNSDSLSITDSSATQYKLTTFNVKNGGTLNITDSDPTETITVTTGYVDIDGDVNIQGDVIMSATQLLVNGNLIIQGNVVLVLDGDLDVGGLVDMQPYTDANGNTVESKLELFVSGDIDVGGTGIANQGKPENFLIYQTQSAADALSNGASTMTLHGSAPMSAAVYAPNTDITLSGGGGSGAFFGAVVGNSVTFSGNNYDFHYDEALADLGGEDLNPNDDSYIPEVKTWVELTDASQKRNMATILTDGF